MKKIFRILLLISAATVLALGCTKDKDKGTPIKPVGRPYIKLSFFNRLVTNKAGTLNITVTSNTTWTAEPQDGWLSVHPSSGSGNANVVISYEENRQEGTSLLPEEREGSINFTITGQQPTVVTIRQGVSRTFKNPIFMPLPDPYVWRDEEADGDVYYYVCKANGNSINLGNKSKKLTELGGTHAVWSLPTSTTAWNKRDLWAPELFHINDGNGDWWYIYYAAGNPELAGLSSGQYGSQRTGVIRCPGNLDPTVKGNWQDMGMVYTGNSYSEGIKPTVDNTIYAIDMTTFVLKGQRYAVWSGNVSATNGEQRLYIATMKNPWTISSSRVEISKADLGWEKAAGERINEGPSVLVNEKAGKVFVVYSANGSWKRHYCLGWLCLDMDDDPMVKANWQKSSGSVFYRNDNVSKSSNPNADDAKNPNTMNIGGVHGVGHNTFTKSPDGTEDWIIYHSKRYKDDGWDNRDCFIQKFTWNEDGTPNLGMPAGWQEELEVPSGEPL